MRHSYSIRNVLLISGVAATHLLFLLGLLSVSFSSEESSVPGNILVSLVGEKADGFAPKKSKAVPRDNAFASHENLGSMQVDEDPSATGAEGVGHLASGAARQTLHSPKPYYPLASRRLREQGLVMVKLCVNEQGVVLEAGISKSSGFHGLDQSALTTLAQWRFAPVTANYTRLSSQCFQTPVQFTLEG